jgi:hypothetical protein
VISSVVSSAKDFLAQELGLEGTVVSVERSEDGWLVLIEAVTPDPEMRMFAKRDLVATFELSMDAGFRVLSFARKAMRERGTAPQV